jgi:hypothetical protein
MRTWVVPIAWRGRGEDAADLKTKYNTILPMAGIDTPTFRKGEFSWIKNHEP